MKKALPLAIAGAFFFAFTFILNRSMNLSGGSWIWSASLRYLFTLPMVALILHYKGGFSRIHQAMAGAPVTWILWSTVGFGLFYAPLAFAGDYGESWLIAASWQISIVTGMLLTPLFGKPIPKKNLAISGLILLGIALLQMNNFTTTHYTKVALTLVPILMAAIAYPLGNRKMMVVCGHDLSTLERVYGMTLASMPFWLLLSGFGLVRVGLPSPSQSLMSFLVALFSGVMATLLFFKATDLVKDDHRQLAVVESTQSAEVIFVLLGGILFLGDALPTPLGFVGIGLIVLGMAWGSLVSGTPS